MIRVTVWGENIHEHTDAQVRELYPQGMHQCIADALNSDPDIQARTATLQQPEHGLSTETLECTDVLTWWGHRGHDLVDDAIVERVQEHVLAGMGLLVLHSAHVAKIFKQLMGTACTLHWRDHGEKERVWACLPEHPICQNLPPYFELDQAEMYGEPFGIPTPDETIFISWFAGGEVFRSGCTWRRGAGHIFYFRPGHETFPIYHNPHIQTVLRNAVHWAAPHGKRRQRVLECTHIPPELAPEGQKAPDATTNNE